MYFLAKNIRPSYSKTFRVTPGKYKFYKNGLLNWKYFVKSLSYFVLHPEQIRQKLKEKDAHMLCQFFDSDEYKKKVVEFLETQGRILSKDTMTGVKPPGSIKYQHVLSCAQQGHKRPKTFIEEIEDDAGERTDRKYTSESRKKKVKRCTIFDELKKRKGRVEIVLKDEEINNNKTLKSEVKKKFRHRSTIMPIFLRKIRERKEQADEEADEENKYGEDNETVDLTYQTARKLKRVSDEPPLYAKILQRTNMYRNNNNRQQKENQQPSTSSKFALREVDSAEESASTLEFFSSTTPYRIRSRGATKIELPQIPKLRTVTFRPDGKNGPETVRYQRIPCRNVLDVVDSSRYKISSKIKSHGFSSVSSSSKPSISTKRMASSIAKKSSSSSLTAATKSASTTNNNRKKRMNLKSFSEFLCVESVMPTQIHKIKSPQQKELMSDDKSVKIDIFHSHSQQKSDNLPSYELLMDQVKKSRSLNNLEKTNTMMQILKYKDPPETLESESLYKKVKMGTLRRSYSVPNCDVVTKTKKPSSFLDRIILKPKIHLEPIKNNKSYHGELESFTYKIVSKNRELLEARMRKKCIYFPSYGSANNSNNKEDDGTCSTKTIRVNLNENENTEKFKIVTENVKKNLHRPVPHFVEHASKPHQLPEFNQYRGFYKKN